MYCLALAMVQCPRKLLLGQKSSPKTELSLSLATWQNVDGEKRLVALLACPSTCKYVLPTQVQATSQKGAEVFVSKGLQGNENR